MKRFLHQWRVVLLLVAALVATGAYLSASVWRERDRLQVQEFDRLSTQARVIEDNLTRQLTAIHHSLQSVESALPRWQTDAAGRMEGLQTLRSMEAVMSSVRTFLVTDAQGVITFSNRDELLGRNVYQRDYVQAPLKALDPTRLYVSPPFKSVLNHYLINLSHVLLDGQGRFAGVVSAAIDPVDFEILLNSVRYSDDMRASLVHGDGRIFINQPRLEQVMGQDLRQSHPFFGQHFQSQQAVSHFSTMMSTTKDARVGVLRTIAPAALVMDKPLVVMLSREQNAVFGPWQRDAVGQVAIFVLVWLITVVGLTLLQRQRAQKIMTTKRLKLATEASGVGIWEFDLITKRYQWDDTMFALFGLDPANGSPRNDEWVKLLTPQDLQRMREATRVTITQDVPFKLTFQIRRPDGQVRFMRNRAALYSDDHGAPRRLIGATEDVTQRKEQEADLRVAAAAFESHESMMVTNAQAEILRVNQAFTGLFGYTASEAVGQTPHLLKSGRQPDSFYATLWSELLLTNRWQGEIWNVRKDGLEFPCWLSISAVCDDTGHVTHYVATHTDITLRKAAEDEVKRLAFFDPLTNLPNRRLLTDRLHQAVTHAKRDQGHLALIFVDLDKFKPVNDRHGHAAGDQLLQSVAHRLRTCVRESDTVARVGGDEFVVLLDGITHADDALQVAEKIHAVLQQPFHLANGQGVHISSSAGIALYPTHGMDEATLSHHADIAMYAAKAAGRDQYVVYDAALAAPVATVLPDTPTAQATPQPMP